MLISIVSLQERNAKKSKKFMKIANIEEENELNRLRLFNDIFKKDVVYDNVKSHKKQDLIFPLKNDFLKSHSGWGESN